MSTTDQQPTRETTDPHVGLANRLLTVDQLAQYLSCGRAYAWTLVSSGQIRSLRIGKLRRVPIEAAEEYIQRQLAEGAA